MAKAKVVLYKQKKLKNGEHPIIISITHNYKRKRFSLGVSASLGDWNEDFLLVNPNAKNAARKNKLIQTSFGRVERIIEKLEEEGRAFDFAEFEIRFKGIEPEGVFSYFEKRIETLNKTGKIGNAIVYKDFYNALLKFAGNPNLSFHEINFKFLKEWEESFKEREVKENSISTYMRTLRALFNRAIKDKSCPSEIYPFKEYKISSLKNETAKRAISREEIKKITTFKCDPNTSQEMSKHIFLFSFYNMGMNFTDIVQLKWENIKNGRIVYTRSKTKKSFSIKIVPPVLEILDRYQKTKGNSEYIFPILTHSNNTPLKIKTRTKSGLKTLNKHLKLIAQELSIESKLTSYVARHSWATILKRQGISTSIISEGLGHSNERITQVYLDSFEKEVLDEVNELLIK